MRIDRRGNPAYRNIPAFGKLDDNPGETGIRQRGQTRAESDRGERDDKVPSTPSDAFSDLECEESGFWNNIANMFTAVGRALQDIKQGNSKTFD
jgi:hypothetical protein